MKPLEKKGYLDQALDNGKGVTWLDSCRIPFAGMSDEEQKDYERVSAFGDSDQSETKDGRNLWGKKATKKVKITKRQPLTDHNAFKQSGFKSEENDTAEASPLGRFVANLVVSDDVLKEDFSRYYSLDAWWRDRFKRLPEEIQRTFPFLIVPKASKSEKNMGLDDFEKQQKIYNGQSPEPSKDMKGVEKKFTTQPSQNFHPTVKPMTLMSYLVTLGSRKNDVVLDPFMGSGTTPMACVTLSRNYIGIEREDEYFKIAEARVNKLENPIKQWEQWI
jgi:site-specific DNA-methyltransferase (adenine-specific)